LNRSSTGMPFILLYAYETQNRTVGTPNKKAIVASRYCACNAAAAPVRAGYTISHVALALIMVVKRPRPFCFYVP